MPLTEDIIITTTTDVSKCAAKTTAEVKNLIVNPEVKPIDVHRFRKYSPYLYEANYCNLDYKFAMKYMEEHSKPFVGGCSGVRKGNWYGRNLDWFYNEEVDFVIHTPAEQGRHATLAVCGASSVLTRDFVESRKWNEIYKVLPFLAMDGINDEGVFAQINVVPGEEGDTTAVPTGEKRDSICTTNLVRYIIDRYDNAVAAIADLQEHVEIYPNKAAKELGFDAHFMIGDADGSTFVLEIVKDSDDIYRLVATENPIITNFTIYGTTPNDDGSYYTPETQDEDHDAIRTNGVQAFGEGLERYNVANAALDDIDSEAAMIELMHNDLDYRKAYSTFESPADPFWYTEFTGTNSHNTVTVASPVNDFSYIVNAAGTMFANRDRSQGRTGTWHTTHTTVYDLEKRSLVIFDPSENDEGYRVNLEMYYTAAEVDNLMNSSGDLTELKSDTDDRDTLTQPNDYNSKFKLTGLKISSNLGITDGGYYSGVAGVRSWLDDSCGDAFEFAITAATSGDGIIKYRSGATTEWGSWKQLATTNYVDSVIGDINTILDQINGEII